MSTSPAAPRSAKERGSVEGKQEGARGASGVVQYSRIEPRARRSGARWAARRAFVWRRGVAEALLRGWAVVCGLARGESCIFPLAGIVSREL
jgi:hypothetical protein